MSIFLEASLISGFALVALFFSAVTGAIGLGRSSVFAFIVSLSATAVASTIGATTEYGSVLVEFENMHTIRFIDSITEATKR